MHVGNGKLTFLSIGETPAVLEEEKKNSESERRQERLNSVLGTELQKKKNQRGQKSKKKKGKIPLVLAHSIYKIVGKIRADGGTGGRGTVQLELSALR